MSRNARDAELSDSRVSYPYPRRLGNRALVGLPGEFVQIVGPHTKADPAALLVQFLTDFGNAISFHLKSEICTSSFDGGQVGLSRTASLRSRTRNDSKALIGVSDAEQI